MASTAIGAAGEDARTITFISKEHKEFYLEYLPKCRWKDVYHKALVYCLGIDRDTRKHVNRIYDFKNGSVKPECLQEGWQTSGSVRVVRMAFNLYCNGTPSVYDYTNPYKIIFRRKADLLFILERRYFSSKIYCSSSFK